MYRIRGNSKIFCLFPLYSKIFCLFYQGEGSYAGEERRKREVSPRSAVNIPSTILTQRVQEGQHRGS